MSLVGLKIINSLKILSYFESIELYNSSNILVLYKNCLFVTDLLKLPWRFINVTIGDDEYYYLLMK